MRKRGHRIEAFSWSTSMWLGLVNQLEFEYTCKPSHKSATKSAPQFLPYPSTHPPIHPPKLTVPLTPPPWCITLSSAALLLTSALFCSAGAWRSWQRWWWWLASEVWCQAPRWIARLSCQTAQGCACVISCSAMHVLTQFRHPLHSLLPQLFIWSQGKGRKGIQVTVSTVLYFLSLTSSSASSPPPSHSNCIAFIPLLQPPIYLFPRPPFPHFLSACRKSKVWICSALFCDSQLASSIGDML